MIRFLTVVQTIALLLFGSIASAQINPACLTDKLDISSGAAASGVLPVGAADPNWTVVTDPDSGTNEPRPAIVIATHGAWAAAMPGSTWVSSYATATNSTNDHYIFENCFCLQDSSGTLNLSLKLRADDAATVFLNGTQVGATGATGGFSSPTPLTLTVPNQLIKAGRNCLKVDLENIGGGVMGFNLSGSLSGIKIIQKAECCNPNGKIQGRKWNDVNGNGIKDSSEAFLPGWVIQLSNGMIAVTDSLGYYTFTGVPPGVYKVTESPQTGWQQTFPATGFHQVTLTANQAIIDKDFGNRKSDVTETGLCSLCGSMKTCCLGRDAEGRAIYSFLIPIDYKSFAQPGNLCNLTLTPPPGVTIVTQSAMVLNPGTTTYVSGTFTVSGTPPSPFCIKISCAGGKENCVAPVCLTPLPGCDVK